MKKGTLTTLSALPAEDTENHHHTTIKKREGVPLSCPQRIQLTAAQSVEKPRGKARISPTAPGEILIQEERTPLLAMSSKIRIYYF